MISVVVPTYNRSSSLIKTIQNILNQNISNIEVIVIDDGSTDDTAIQIKKLNNACVKIYKNKKNIGSTMSRVVGIQNSSFNYIAFLDDDDFWLPNKLKKQLNIIKKNNCDFVMCDFLINNSVDKKKTY